MYLAFTGLYRAYRGAGLALEPQITLPVRVFWDIV
jgi:hypothetical protein